MGPFGDHFELLAPPHSAGHCGHQLRLGGGVGGRRRGAVRCAVGVGDAAGLVGAAALHRLRRRFAESGGGEEEEEEEEEEGERDICRLSDEGTGKQKGGEKKKKKKK